MENRVFLRAFEFADLDILNSLRNDEESFNFTVGNKFYISKEYNKKWIEDKIINNINQIYLAICLIETKELIGYLGITDIDYRNRKAKWAGINIDLKSTGNGYGTDAARLLIKYTFEELGLNRFYGYWLESNVPSLKMAEKLGFVKEGLLRDFVFKKNGFQNVYLLSLLKTDYYLINNIKK